jgi:hypothetical protein
LETLGSWNEVEEQRSYVHPYQEGAYSPIEQFSFFVPQFDELHSPNESFLLMQQLNMLKSQFCSFIVVNK